MSNSIYLIFGCHSHQPVGNFDFVFKEAYEKAYLPFIDVLERYPAVRVTHHFSGPLLDYFEAEQPAFLERLGALVLKGQIEIMGGGYYEPLLCAIPERDSIAQMQRMNAFCERHFGRPPRGMWLPERVWEPHMPRIIQQAGLEYTALDDSHFLCSGLERGDLFGCYVTEDAGHCIKVFPILEPLRYMVPFHRVEESIDYLRQHASEDGMRCAVLHDDGEKFGTWPGTHKSVYTDGWLDAFFQALTDNQDWLHSVTYSQYLDKAAPKGRAYITCASYKEMMEWALPTAMQRRLKHVHENVKARLAPHEAQQAALFLRGGFWRSFLAKYPESNNVQKRMLRCSARLARLEAANHPQWPEAQRLLHKGQCNCAYWHGVFGGLYLNHLRTALYENLIAADRVMDGIEHDSPDWVACETVDFDADGRPEAVLENNVAALYLAPHDGGTLFEWDYKPQPFNFVNTLTRREEPYHEALRAGAVRVGPAQDGDHSIHELVQAKEAGLAEYLVYDPYRRVCLRDHFLPSRVSAKALWLGAYEELGDFAQGAYCVETGAEAAVLRRRGQVLTAQGATPVSIVKTITLPAQSARYEVRYAITNEGPRPLEANFGVEFAVNLLSGTAYDRYYRSDDRDLKYAKLGTRGCWKDLTHLALRDDWQRLECALRFDAPAAVHRFAVETVSQSEGGQERVYQGSVVMACWAMTWAPGATQERRITGEVVPT